MKISLNQFLNIKETVYEQETDNTTKREY